MMRACSRCGKIHPLGYKCNAGRIYNKGSKADKLRKKNKWKEKSKEIRERANNLCEVCRDKGLYTYDNLEVHHITPINEDSGLLLDNLNLICLCSSCHKQAEAGKIDKDYLFKLAKQREETII